MSILNFLNYFNDFDSWSGKLLDQWQNLAETIPLNFCSLRMKQNRLRMKKLIDSFHRLLQLNFSFGLLEIQNLAVFLNSVILAANFDHILNLHDY